MTPYLQVEDLSKSFGDLLLFSNFRFSVNKDQRVGLIARNGAGKTTLLRIIAGVEPQDAGAVTWPKGLRVGYLDQYPVLDPSRSILENVFTGAGDASGVIVRYEKALLSSSKEELEQALELMDSHNAWERELKAKQILTRLKIEDYSKPIDSLSGGQRKRVALARVLITEPDFLILDEPTNHLDLDMVEWLEDYLLNSHITLLMVTHDRYFLNRVSTDILEIDHRELFWYKGDYRYFLEKRQERIEARTSQTDRAENLLRKETEWMRRSPPARTTKAKYRIDAFYELRAKASQRYGEGNVRIRVGAARLGSKILEVKGLTKSFDGQTVLRNFSYTFNRFERLGIVGRNGTGKSTLLNLIAESLTPDSGSIDLGETVVFGYYRQEGMAIDSKKRVIEVAREVAEVVTLSNGKTLSVSQLLTMFLFPPSVQNAYVYKLSGGEKRRLYLLTILMRNPNFLILDEPTNDLDIETLNVLEAYLEGFPGVLVVVSHDRHFLDKVVDGLLVFEGDGEVSGFPGSYTDYHLWQLQQQKEALGPTKARGDDKPRSAKPREETQQAKKLTYSERRELELLPSEIEKLGTEKVLAEEAIGSGKLSHRELEQLSLRIGEIVNLLDEKEMRWLVLMEKQ